MKQMLVIIKNEKGQILPLGDVETFTVFADEIPMIGDCFFLDDEENISEKDQTSYLNFFCLMQLAGSRSGFRFKVVGRTIFRKDGESWVCVELQHEPTPKE